MKNVTLKPLLCVLMMIVFVIHMVSVFPAYAAEIESSSSIAESETSTSVSESESSTPTSSIETSENIPSLDTTNSDPTPKPNPDTAPKSEATSTPDTTSKAGTNSAESTGKDFTTFESALTSSDVTAIRSDLYAIRNLMEEFIYIVLPLCAAVIIVFIFCYWFYCTFIKGAL